MIIRTRLACPYESLDASLRWLIAKAMAAAVNGPLRGPGVISRRYHEFVAVLP
jgi:hypothetical protein